MGACAKLAVAPDNSKKQPLRMAGFDRCPPILLNTVCNFIVLSFRTRQVVHSLHAFHHLFAHRHHLMVSAHHVTLARCPAVLRVLAHPVARKHRSPRGRSQEQVLGAFAKPGRFSAVRAIGWFATMSVVSSVYASWERGSNYSRAFLYFASSTLGTNTMMSLDFGHSGQGDDTFWPTRGDAVTANRQAKRTCFVSCQLPMSTPRRGSLDGKCDGPPPLD